MNEIPVALSIKKAERQIYQELSQTKPLNGIENKRIFLLAMGIGFLAGKKGNLKGDKNSYVRTEYIKDDMPLLNALAIFEKGNPEVVGDKKEVCEIAEQYASGGIKTLKRYLDEPGDFVKKLESMLRDELEKLEII